MVQLRPPNFAVAKVYGKRRQPPTRVARGAQQELVSGGESVHRRRHEQHHHRPDGPDRGQRTHSSQLAGRILAHGHRSCFAGVDRVAPSTGRRSRHAAAGSSGGCRRPRGNLLFPRGHLSGAQPQRIQGVAGRPLLRAPRPADCPSWQPGLRPRASDPSGDALRAGPDSRGQFGVAGRLARVSGPGVGQPTALGGRASHGPAGALVGFLRTGVPHYFRRTGWAFAAAQLQPGRRPGRVSTLLDRGLLRRRRRLQIRPWRRWEQAPLTRIYHQNVWGGYGPLERTEAYWQWLIRRQAYNQIYVALDGPGLLDLDETHTRVVGYAVTHGEKIVEMFAAPDRPRALASCSPHVPRRDRARSPNGPAACPGRQSLARRVPGIWRVSPRPRGRSRRGLHGPAVGPARIASPPGRRTDPAGRRGRGAAAARTGPVGRRQEVPPGDHPAGCPVSWVDWGGATCG